MIITPELCAKLVICVSLLGDGGSAKGIRKGNPLRGGSPGHLFSENLSHRVHGKPCRQIQTLGQGITSLSTLFMQCVCVDRPGDFPVALVVKNTSANAGDMRHKFLGRSPGGRNGNPLQYSCVENSMDRGAWHVTVHRVTKSLK